MNYLSVCSGVEAASQAWEQLGWTPVAFSEIEPFPCAVLASRFPNVPNLGDMSKIHYNRETKELYNDTTRLVCNGGIDLLVGGTPCQSFSVAGKRAGLEGASGLAYHYARLIGEIRPRWFVWENVPGALSSVTYGDQRDFNFLLQQFAIGGDASLGARWNLCWRVLDTQYVRVERFPLAIPQRRRRVFVVGHIAERGGSGCEVLLEPEGVRGNPAPRRVKGQGFTRHIGACPAGADGAGCEGRGIETQSFDFLASQSIDHCDKAYERAETCRRQDGCGVGVAVRTAIGVKFGEMVRLDNHAQVNREQMPTLSKSDGKAGDNTPTVAMAYRIDPLSSNSMKSANPHSGIHKTEVHCALDTTDPTPTKAQGGVAICTAAGVDFYNGAVGETSMTLASAAATDKNHTGGVVLAVGIGGDCAGTLDANYYKGCGERQGTEREVVAQATGGVDCLTPSHPQTHRVYGTGGAYPAPMANHGDKSGADESAICASVLGTLCADDHKGVGNQWVSDGKCVVERTYSMGTVQAAQATTPGDEVSHTLDCMHDAEWIARQTVETYENHAADARVAPTDCAATIGAERNTGLDNNNPLCAYRYAVRRITPIEGERLQGFKDFWTRPCFAPAEITDALCDRFVAVHKAWAAINGNADATPKSREWVRKWLSTISSPDCPDGPRYKAIGNSMSVNVMEWIGERIDAADRAERRAQGGAK